MSVKLIIGVVLCLSIVLPMVYYYFSERRSGNFKIAVGFNSVFFFGTLLIAGIMLFSGNASAAEATQEAAQASGSWKYIAAALSTGMSCIGAGIAVASAASSALGALSEDSSIMGKALIFVALAESIALYGLLISFSILG